MCASPASDQPITGLRAASLCSAVALSLSLPWSRGGSADRSSGGRSTWSRSGRAEWPWAGSQAPQHRPVCSRPLTQESDCGEQSGSGQGNQSPCPGTPGSDLFLPRLLTASHLCVPCPQESVPAVLQAVRGVHVPHRGHLPGVAALPALCTPGPRPGRHGYGWPDTTTARGTAPATARGRGSGGRWPWVGEGRVGERQMQLTVIYGLDSSMEDTAGRSGTG